MGCKPNIFKQGKQGQSQPKKIFDIFYHKYLFNLNKPYLYGMIPYLYGIIPYLYDVVVYKYYIDTIFFKL